MLKQSILHFVFWFSIGFALMYFLIVAWLLFVWPLLVLFVHGWL